MAREHWTGKEIEFLEQHVGKMTIPTLAKRLTEECGYERSATAVYTKLKRLGITNMYQETGRMSANELAGLVGVDYHAVKRWITKGMLTAVKRKVVYERQHYLISTENFWEFAEKHKEHVNFLRIEPNSIAPEPEWVAAERKKEYYDMPKRQSKLWDEEEDKLLISMRKAGHSVQEISERLKRTVASIHTRKTILAKQGLMPYDQVTIRWSKREIELFYKLEEKGYTTEQIAYELGREEHQVRYKRHYLRKTGQYKGSKQKWEHGNVS